MRYVASLLLSYGLRDYGTGKWEGGDPGHEHDRVAARNGRGGSGSPGKNTQGAYPSDHPAAECSCGAVYRDPQIGLEEHPDEWCARLVDVFREVRRVLRSDGTCWVEIGDSFNSGTSAKRKPSDAEHGAWSLGSDAGHERVSAPGLKTKDLIGAPWMLAFALRADGWYLRSDIVWMRPNPMPESVTDRPTKAHSYVFLLAKQARYFYDADAIREPSEGGDTNPRSTNGQRERTDLVRGFDTRINTGSRNKRSVWSIATQPLPFDHYAAYPEKLVEPCILAGTSEHGVCADCGAPWEREVERTPAVIRRSERSPFDHHSTRASGRQIEPPRSETTGWRPTCGCDAGVVPATILDPFLGSGTTALVARRFGRRCVGIELNQAYCDLAAGRLAQQSLLALEADA